MEQCKACGKSIQDEDNEYCCGICGHDFCSSDCFNSDTHDQLDADVLDEEEGDPWS